MRKFFHGVWLFAYPLIYLFLWIFAIKLLVGWIGVSSINGTTVAILSVGILFIGMLARSTSWSIGGDWGIKADSLGKYLEFHSGGNPGWDYKIYIDDNEIARAKLKESEEIVKTINKDSLYNERHKQNKEGKNN